MNAARSRSKCGLDIDRGSWEEMFTTSTGQEFPYRAPGLSQKQNLDGFPWKQTVRDPAYFSPAREVFCSTYSQLRHYPFPFLPKGLLCLTPALPLLLVSFTTSHTRKKSQQILNRSSELCLSVVVVKANGSEVEMIVLFPSQKSHSHLGRNSLGYIKKIFK